MNTDRLKWGRERIRKDLGAKLAEKASDAVCLAYRGPDQPFATRRIIVELVPVPLPTPALHEAVLEHRVTAGLIDALDTTRIALQSAGDAGVARRAVTLMNPFTVLRNLYIDEMVERCYRQAGPIREALERGITRALGIGTVWGALPASSLTDFCWLNQTIRVPTEFRTLAEIAGDPLIKSIDHPRPLKREMDETGGVVGAVEYRTATNSTGDGIVVGVIDGEVDHRHSAFQDRVIPRANFTFEGWGKPDRHGTAVAGIIAARGDMIGMAPGARIYNYKIFNTDDAMGFNMKEAADDFDGAQALAQATLDRVRIANCSWGSSAPTDGTSREVLACENAWNSGTTVVKSAGNKGSQPDAITSPADASGVIVVGATDRAGVRVPPYSSRGTTLNRKQCPDLVAPGGDDGLAKILSCKPGGGFGKIKSGTSLSAAHVTGLLALMLEKKVWFNPQRAAPATDRSLFSAGGREQPE